MRVGTWVPPRPLAALARGSLSGEGGGTQDQGLQGESMNPA